MSKKPAPKKKQRPLVSAVDMSARGATAKSIRRVVSYALASGMRNVMSVEIHLCCPPVGGPYREVNIVFIDHNLKARW